VRTLMEVFVLINLAQLVLLKNHGVVLMKLLVLVLVAIGVVVTVVIIGVLILIVRLVVQNNLGIVLIKENALK